MWRKAAVLCVAASVFSVHLFGCTAGLTSATKSALHSRLLSQPDDTKMDFARLRREMITRTIKSRGITNQRVLQAMDFVKREDFVEPDQRAYAYDDNPLHIGKGQTISQPYIVALMADALRIQPTDRILDVGTGSGYSAAVLSKLGAEVYTIERIASLAESASQRLKQLGYDTIHVFHGDGTVGLPEYAPYNAIAVAAASPQIPETLVSQLAEGGRIVIPVENEQGYQDLLLGVKVNGNIKVREICGVRFVPLIGKEGVLPLHMDEH